MLLGLAREAIGSLLFSCPAGRSVVGASLRASFWLLPLLLPLLLSLVVVGRLLLFPPPPKKGGLEL